MHYLCPLAVSAKFKLTILGQQRNCNATETDAMSGEVTCYYSPSYALDSRKCQTSGQSKIPVSSQSSDSSQPKEDVCTYGKRVGFATPCRSRIRSHSLQRNMGTSASGQCTPERSWLADQSSMLVPLSSNHSILRLTVDKSANNAKEESHEVSGCNTKDSKDRNDKADLLTGSGVPYWNIYEYQDFRELQHGEKQIFDPQTDLCLHRESIILDNYNRLMKSYPRFRMPVPMYHLR